MQLRELMTRKVETIGPDQTIFEAAEKMKSANVGILPVLMKGEPVGVLTDRDITIRVTAEGRDPNHTLARDIMTHDHFCCFEDQQDSEAAEIMEGRQIRRLLVLNRDRKLVGLISVDDLATSPGEEELACEVLRQCSENVVHQHHRGH